MRKKRDPAAKSTVVTVRLDPRMRYGLDLLARKRLRTMTSVIEWALSRAIEDKENGLFGPPSNDPSGKPQNLLDEVWDPDESDRFVKLALREPRLLRFEEEQLWKAIRENSEFWRGGKPNYPAIRQRWDKLKSEFGI